MLKTKTVKKLKTKTYPCLWFGEGQLLDLVYRFKKDFVENLKKQKHTNTTITRTPNSSASTYLECIPPGESALF
jgi:hypothetical protein